MSSSSKARARNRKTARKKKQQQQTVLYGAIGLAVVAVVAVLLIAIANTPLAGDVPDDSLTRYVEVPQGTTDEGLPYLGAADAPVTIHEYSSFSCTHCKDFHDNQFAQLLNSEIADGTVRLVYVPVYLGDADVGGQAASHAAYCALEQGHFWEMHDALFYWQAVYGAGAFDSRRFSTAAGEIGLDVGAFNACLSSADTDSQVEASQVLWQALVNQSSTDNITGTPTLTFNGQPAAAGSGALPIDTVRQQIAQAMGG